MPTDRRNWLGLIMTASLTVSACHSPLHGRGVSDGSVRSFDGPGGRDGASTNQDGSPDKGVDAGLDQSRARDITVFTADTLFASDVRPETLAVDAAPDQVILPRDSAGADSPLDPGMADAAGRAEVAGERDDAAGSLAVSSTSLAFGQVALGFSRVQRLTITNRRQEASGALVLGTDNNEFTIRSLAPGDCEPGRTLLARGASCAVAVVYSPSFTGSRPGTLSFSASPGGAGSVVLAGLGVIGTLSPLAGAVSGLGSADGTGAAARFNGPVGLALDGSGNLFVADTENHTIRKITPTGVVSTLAGKPGIEGSADGEGALARFSYPGSVAVDRGGNLYVSDCNNQMIRKISPTGLVTTLAGVPNDHGSEDGTGSAARFESPGGLAVDDSGTVFVNDITIVRRITPAGVVTTLAGAAGNSGSQDGTGAEARFDDLKGMTLDDAGNLLVVQADGSIRKVTQAGVVTTVVRPGGNYTLGLARGSAGNLFIADYFDNVIRKITPAGVVTTLAGKPGIARGADGTGTAARFYGPAGIAVDAAGNLLVSDSSNCAIRKITPVGGVTTIAGTLGSRGLEDGTGAAASFDLPSGLAVDSADNIFVTDRQVLRKISPAGVVTTFAGIPDAPGSQDGIGSAAQFTDVTAVAADSADNLFVTDRHCLRKITPAGVVSTLAGKADLLGSQDGMGAAARFNFPRGLVVDLAGNLIVADSMNNTIRRVTSAGVVTTLASEAGTVGSEDGTGAGARFVSPEGIARNEAGNLVVSDTGNSLVRRITPSGLVTTLAGKVGLREGQDGTGSGAHIGFAHGLAVDGAGNAFVADCGNNAIRKVTPDGVVTTVVGVLSPLPVGDVPGPLPASLNCPMGVAFNGDGHLIIAISNAVLLVSW